ncbi:YbhB/YbcL family Raf kinase inhibitor-like protein [Nonomuraea sp. NPDC050310]|uniref:YbhB/YbcL family Raf kinase inhibitor-like protein n=1 Tax=Nonomuraea sp. NPDC050310 TaxID=3154935 RepID=UPI0033D55264
MAVKHFVLTALLAGSAANPSAAFTVTSSAFAPGGLIPKVHECTSSGTNDPRQKNESVPLSWSGAPTGARSYAVIMRDLDNSQLIHWVIYDIPAGVTSLPQNVDHTYRPSVPAGARQVYYRGSASLYGYQGPCSPRRVNTYEFTVHALNRATLSELTSSSSTSTAARVITAATLGTARVSGES